MRRDFCFGPSFVIRHPSFFKLLAAIAICSALWSSSTPAIYASSSNKSRARAERALREGEFELAEKLYREMIAKDGHDATARLGLSFALLKKRNLRDAFDAAARVIAVDPTSARAHALLGAVLLTSGDFRLSVEEFRTALSFNDNEALAIAGLAMVDFYENRASASLSGLRRAIFIDPNEPDYLFSFAQAAARSERYREAADAYERFLQVAPRTDEDRRARIRGLIDFLRYLGTQRQLYQVGGPSRSSILFELTNSRPVIEVRINGSKSPLRFVVDTGSGMCVLSDEAAQRIGLRPVARGGLTRAVGGGGRFEIIYGFLSSLHIGEARIENVPVYIRQFHNAQEPVDGYIGLSVMSKYLTTIDYAKRTMTFLRDEERSASLKAGVDATHTPAVELPIRTTASGFWSGEVLVEGVSKPLNFIIDTGASTSVVSEALTKREDMERFVQKVKLRVYGAAGISENVQLLLLPRLTLGSIIRPNVSAAVLDMEPINETSGFEQTGIVGGNILRHYRVTFDFQRAILRLEPHTPPATPVSNSKNMIEEAMKQP